MLEKLIFRGWTNESELFNYFKIRVIRSLLLMEEFIFIFIETYLCTWEVPSQSEFWEIGVAVTQSTKIMNLPVCDISWSHWLKLDQIGDILIISSNEVLKIANYLKKLKMTSSQAMSELENKVNYLHNTLHRALSILVKPAEESKCFLCLIWISYFYVSKIYPQFTKSCHIWFHYMWSLYVISDNYLD